jgi:hypothetical protein
MPGHSASKTRVNALVLPGIQVLLRSSKEGVDGRDKPGHDVPRVIAHFDGFAQTPRFCISATCLSITSRL